MTNFFKKLFGKKENETSDNMSKGERSERVTILNNCIRNAYLKGNAREVGDEILKNKELIEKSFPDEPDLFNHVYFIVSMVNALISENKLTDDSVVRLKRHAHDKHIDEETIDFIISAKKKCPETYKYHAPMANQLDRYGLEFKIVPLIVQTYNEAFQSGGVAQGKEDIFMNIPFWQHIASTMKYTSADFDWNEISFNRKLIGNKQCIAITFPKPLKSPQAIYGLVVIDKKASYYTLEKSATPFLGDASGDNYWYLCGVDDAGRHVNYGQVIGNLTASQFVEEVFKRCYSH